MPVELAAVEAEGAEGWLGSRYPHNEGYLSGWTATHRDNSAIDKQLPLGSGGDIDPGVPGDLVASGHNAGGGQGCDG